MSPGHILIWTLAVMALAVGIRLAWPKTLGERRRDLNILSRIGYGVLRFLGEILLNLIINLILTVIINIIVNIFWEIITLGQADPIFVGGGGLLGGGGASGSW